MTDRVEIGPHTIHVGDCLESMRAMPAASVHCCVTSPPYWALRDYGCEGQIGLEPTLAEYVAKMVDVFREVKRVLRDDGTLWCNLGDTYGGPAGNNQSGMSAIGGGQKTKDGAIFTGRPHACGTRSKDLCGVPWRVAFALQADGWWLRQDIVWHKPAPMPESVTDRCTKAHEYLFLLTKRPAYYYDADAIKEKGVTPQLSEKAYRAVCDDAAEHWYTRVTGEVEGSKSGNKAGGFCPPGGRNRRSVWTIPAAPYAEAHFATFPPALVEPCVKAGTSERGACPACGSPWRRVVDREQLLRKRPNSFVKRGGEAGTGNCIDLTREGVATRTTGWRPTCGCPPAEPVPCVVLDPFGGSGTTVAVAAGLGRVGVACEMNPAYVAMARNRIAAAVANFEGGPLLAAAPASTVGEVTASLFDSIDGEVCV